MNVDYPKGLPDIVREVYREIELGKSLGPHSDQMENGVDQVLSRILDRGLPKNLGLQLGGESDGDAGAAQRKVNTLNWAARQYLRLLLTDCGRFGEVFKDHWTCNPTRNA